MQSTVVCGCFSMIDKSYAIQAGKAGQKRAGNASQASLERYVDRTDGVQCDKADRQIEDEC